VPTFLRRFTHQAIPEKSRQSETAFPAYPIPSFATGFLRIQRFRHRLIKKILIDVLFAFPKCEQSERFILGLWHRGFAAGGSLRPFRLPPFVRVLDVRAIAECRVLDERKPSLLARSPGVTATAIRLT
jgi:hypothetical protein